MSERKDWIIPTLAFVVGLLVIYFFKGTGDHGDSVQHFLFARDAWKEPMHLMDHWAKPLWTLIASPFCQFGFDGVKVFNLLCFCGCLYFTQKISRATNGTSY